MADVVELLAPELVSVALGRRVTGRRLRIWDVLIVRLVGLRFQLAPEGVVISTWNGDPRPPPFKRPGTGPPDEGALYFVPMLAQAWDYFETDGGKMIRCEVAIPTASESRLPQRLRIVAPSRPPTWTTADPTLLMRVLHGLRRLDDDQLLSDDPTEQIGYNR